MDTQPKELEIEIPTSPFMPSDDLLKLQQDTEDMIDSWKDSLVTPQHDYSKLNGDDSAEQQLQREGDRHLKSKKVLSTSKPLSRNYSFLSDDGISGEIQRLEESMPQLMEDLESSSSPGRNRRNVLARLFIADSEFMGFISPVSSREEAELFQLELKKSYFKASHIPLAFISHNDTDRGFDEDGEPEHSVGPLIMSELKNAFEKKMFANGLALCIVRNFKSKLLGVTCGRLSQLYRECAILSIHRYIHGDTSEIFRDLKNDRANRFGLGAGDCELILDILEDDNIFQNSDPESCVQSLIDELQFDGFRGSTDEELPRLQNLQADVSEGLVPVYRYPGNYHGDEWLTFQWSPTSLKIRDAVESALKPLVNQRMNHCVTNYYRDGDDFIAHHSDKDLDLDKDAVIVSVSIGDERVLELKRRANPRDCTHIVLPHGSMLVLGPKTNREWTHSILQKEKKSNPRISLTFRHVVSFMDLKTGYLFGDDIQIKSLHEVRRLSFRDDIYFLLGLGHMCTILCNKSKEMKNPGKSLGVLLASTALSALSYFTFKRLRLDAHRKREESFARSFFSDASIHGTIY